MRSDVGWLRNLANEEDETRTEKERRRERVRMEY